jgi:single-stranded-DNA-specific exonuclease
MNADIVRRAVPASANVLEQSGIDAILARIYAARGIADVHELDTTLAALPPPSALRNVDAAAARLARAVTQRERIVIVADYDADGATACAVGIRGLRAFGADVDFVVPNRFDYGYGLTPEIVALAAQREPRLLVTVDNGIASIDGVAEAAARGIDVLITDHHLPGAELPSPAIIVNPNQLGCGFPSKHIAGVGVMFFVLAATRAHLRAAGHFGTGDAPNLGVLLDLVALGTVADVVRLDHVNRVLVEQGLRRLRAGVGQPGIAALFATAGRDVRRATAFDLGFVAGPRLNAAGRLADMSTGIHCLLAETASAAQPLAAELDRMNRERREIEAVMQDDALAALADVAEAPDDRCTVCVYRPEWHQGVVGIVAARLKDRFHRPAIVFARGNDGALKGSGRSIAGLHLRDALDLVAKRAPGVVTRFGGHAFAAGLTIAESALPAFAAAFEAVARDALSAADLRRLCETDGALAPGELTLDLASRLASPVWGQGFPAPTFDDRFEVVDQRTVGGSHSRLRLRRGNETFDGMLFGHTDPLPRAIRAAYRPDVNTFQQLASLQLVIVNWQPASAD